MNDAAIVRLDSAQRALAECKTLMEAKHIADVAEAARVYLERTNAASETVARAAEIRTLAERQMGQFLKVMPKAKPGPKIGSDEEPNSPATLSDIGITKKQSATSQQLANIPEPEFQQRIADVKADGDMPTPARVLAVDQKKKRKAFTMPDQAMFIARGAVAQLERISPDDGERTEAFNHVIDWCQQQLTKQDRTT